MSTVFGEEFFGVYPNRSSKRPFCCELGKVPWRPWCSCVCSGAGAERRERQRPLAPMPCRCPRACPVGWWPVRPHRFGSCAAHRNRSRSIWAHWPAIETGLCTVSVAPDRVSSMWMVSATGAGASGASGDGPQTGARRSGTNADSMFCCAGAACR